MKTIMKSKQQMQRHAKALRQELFDIEYELKAFRQEQKETTLTQTEFHNMLIAFEMPKHWAPWSEYLKQEIK